MSKLLIFDFRCDDCGTFERMVKPSVRAVPCPKCGGTAWRLVPAPALSPKMGLDPNFPTAYAKWGDTRNKRAIIDRRHFKEHGSDRTPGADTAG